MQINYHFAISERDKQKYDFVVKTLMHKMQGTFGQDIFSKLRNFDVYHVDNRSESMKKYGALGLAYFNGDIETTWSGFQLADRYVAMDVHIAAMELAHNALLALLPDNQFTDEFNNLIHYAANYAKLPYMMPGQMTFRTLQEAQARPRVRPDVILLKYYNLARILQDMKKINDEIKAGTAPDGVNPYWTVKDFAPLKASGIFSVCYDNHAGHLEEL